MACSNPALTREMGGLLRKSADAIRKVCGSSPQNLQTLITTQCIGLELQVLYQVEISLQGLLDGESACCDALGEMK